MNNSLFAEQLALKLNILASDYGMFPTGFGDLIYDASNVDPTDPFNGDSVRKVVRIVDDYLSCKSTVAGADSTRYLNVLHNLNLAFRDSVLDTLSWSCSSLRFRGIRTVQEVVFMRGGTTNTPALPFAYVPNSLDEPTSFSLKQNYPNPFNPTTNIQFELPNPGTVTLVVYNILGQEITRLLDRQRVDAGVQEVQFNAQQLPSGVYFYRIVAEIGGSDETGATDQGIKTFVSVKKMLLLK
jgi:hypothetical protein